MSIQRTAIGKLPIKVDEQPVNEDGQYWNNNQYKNRNNNN